MRPAYGPLQMLLATALTAGCASQAPPGPAPPETEEAVPRPVVISPEPDRPAPPARPDSISASLPPDTVESLHDVRIGVSVGADTVVIGGGDALVIFDRRGGFIGAIPRGERRRLARSGAHVAVVDRPDGGGSGRNARSPAIVRIAPREAGGFLRLGQKDYRGELWVFPGGESTGRGLTVVNRLGVESYLAGVIPAEMGRREPAERPALEAQAVVSRTFTIRNLGKREANGFDLLATVADQVYGGVAAETGAGWAAIRATRHQVLTYRGRVIDAFFFSTCGGRTAAGPEVFRAAERPYLQTMWDVSPSGEAYCRISPRFRWQVEWTPADLAVLFRQTLPPVASVSERDIDSVGDVRVAGRTVSGRVAAIAIDLRGRSRETVTVRGPDIRRVLRAPPPPGQLLLSAAFDLSTDAPSGRLVATGSGAGHGVGFCQWGAIGRARAGQTYAEILEAYFPNTQLERLN